MLPTMQTWSLSDSCAICTHIFLFCISIFLKWTNQKFTWVTREQEESGKHTWKNDTRNLRGETIKIKKKLTRGVKCVWEWAKIAVAGCGWRRKSIKNGCVKVKLARIRFYSSGSSTILSENLRTFRRVFHFIPLLQANKTRLPYDFQSDKNCEVNFLKRELRFSHPTLFFLKNPLEFSSWMCDDRWHADSISISIFSLSFGSTVLAE